MCYSSCVYCLGNKNLLKVDEMWRKLLNMYEKNDCILNADDFPWTKTTGIYTADDDIPRIGKKYNLERKDKELIYGDQSNAELKPPTDYIPSLHSVKQKRVPKRRPKVPMQNRMN